MTEPSSDAMAELAALEEKAVALTFELSPGYAVSAGRHEYDGRLPSLSREATDTWVAEGDRVLGGLHALEARPLSRERTVDRLLLELLLEGSRFDLVDARLYDSNPMLYLSSISLSAYTVRPYAPMEARAEAMLRLVGAIPRFLEEATRRLDPVLPAPFLLLSASMGAGLPGHYAECESAIRAKLPAQANRFRDARARAEESLRRFLERLDSEYRPRQTREFALGAERFQRLLWVREGLRMSIAELKAAGLEDLRKNQERLATVAASREPPVTTVDLLASASGDHATAEQLLPEVRAFLEETKRWLAERDIVSLPEPAVCRVEETPVYGRSLSTASMDSPGPFEEGGTEGVYYVTPVDPTWSPERQEEWLRAMCRPILRNITVHEVYPGHYLQFLHLRRSAASLARKTYLSPSFVEGWAHYCEQLAVEQGIGGGQPIAEAVQLQDALLRNCRLLVSIGLHTEGMTLDEGTAFFRREGHMEQLPAERESIRGSFNPEYFCYTLGKLMILRARAKHAGADRASLKRFHDRILSSGCPPVGLLDSLLAAAPAGG
ncbi:MAG: DUF885 domain-containing protein [Thermoplasmata archaeon]|nr:DUF885 domain-containing protein [Thermoplasmata archaeon]